MKKIIKNILITIIILFVLFVLFKPRNVFLFSSDDNLNIETNEAYE